ncbi:MAG: hypothetical protein P1U78_02820 [Alcanivoracaceae bacterium]|nr:hypothetical protein [Alcanivoracaceae bacterium]
MPEIILKIGAEGGSITLYGVRRNNDFERFSINTYDCSDDEAEDDASRDISQISSPNSASSWPDALNLLKRYPSWYRLYPLVLHPDFESRILEEVRNCGGDAALELWREALSET